MKNFNKTFKLITESPDELTIDHDSGEYVSWREMDTYTLMTLGNSVFYIESVAENGTHGDMIIFLYDFLKNKNRPPTTPELKLNGIKTVNYDPDEIQKNKDICLDFFVRHMKYAGAKKTKTSNIFPILSGRYWDEYRAISFWNDIEDVIAHIDPIADFLKVFGASPNSIDWEVYDPKEGIEILIPFEKLTGYNYKSSKEEKELKQRQLAKHLQAGMKKYDKDSSSPGMKQITPNIPNAQYRQLTTFGDSYNKIVGELLKEDPDTIKIGRNKWYYRERDSIAFMIKGDEIIILPENLSHSMFFNNISKIIETYKNTTNNSDENKIIDSDDDLIKYTKNALDDLNVITHNLNYSNFLQKVIQKKIRKEYYIIDNAISGRIFYIEDAKYLTFWNTKSQIIKNISNVLKMLSLIGENPKDLFWELPNGNITSFEKYIKNYYKDTTEDTAKLKAAAQAHLQAGMRGLTQNDKPAMKQINPSMPNVQYRDLTTIGDSYNNLVGHILNEQKSI
jgi:hypothetical protein